MSDAFPILCVAFLLCSALLLTVLLARLRRRRGHSESVRDKVTRMLITGADGWQVIIRNPSLVGNVARALRICHPSVLRSIRRAASSVSARTRARRQKHAEKFTNRRSGEYQVHVATLFERIFRAVASSPVGQSIGLAQVQFDGFATDWIPTDYSPYKEAAEEVFHEANEGDAWLGYEVEFISLSGGTTGSPKFVPRSPNNVDAELAVYCDPPESNTWFQFGPDPTSALNVGTLTNGFLSPSGLLTCNGTVRNYAARSCRVIGDGLLGQLKLPFMVAPPFAYFCQDYWVGLHFFALAGLGNRDLRCITAHGTAVVTEMVDRIQEGREEIVETIRTGRCSDEYLEHVPDAFGSRSFLRPDPSRADEICEALDQGTVGLLSRLWPRLQFIRAMSEGSFEPNTVRLRKMLDPAVSIVDFDVHCTEGIYGYHLFPGGDLFTPFSAISVCEFIPLDSCGAATPRVLSHEEINVGEEYMICISSLRGFFRLMTGDLVVPVFCADDIPVLRYVGRFDFFEFDFGKMMAHRVLEEFQRRFLHRYQVREFTSLARMNRLEFQIEFEGDRPPEGKLETDIRELDKDLARTCHDYGQWRQRELIRMPCISVLAEGTFKNWKSNRLCHPGVSGHQLKPIRVLREKNEFIEEGVLYRIGEC